MLKVMRDNLKSLKWVLWFVVFVFVLLIFVDWGAGRAGSRGMEGVAARVGNVTITETVFLKELRTTEQRFRSMYGEQYEQVRGQLDLATMTMQNLVDRELLLREAAQMGLTADNQDVLERIQSYPVFQREDGSFVGEQLYSRILRSNQMTAEEFEGALRRDLVVERLQNILQAGIIIPDSDVEREYRERNETASGEVLFISMDRALDRTSVSDEEALAFYQAHQDRFTHPEQRKLQYLLVDSFRLRRTMTVTEEEISSYYDSHPEEFGESEQVSARHILIRPEGDDAPAWQAAQQRAGEVYARSSEPGTDFAALARELSEDTGSKESGGDLGWFGRGRMVKEFEDAVFALTESQVSAPVRSQFGFHVIKLEGRRPGRTKSLSEVRSQVRDKLAAGVADGEGSRRATALRERIDAGRLTTEEQWRELGDDVVSSNVTPFFPQGDSIPGLGRDPELVAEVMQAAEGLIGGPRRSARGWIVYRIVAVRPAGTTPFEEAKQEAVEAAKRVKALEVLRAEVNSKRESLLAGEFEVEAATLGATVEKIEEHRRGGALPGVGSSRVLEDAIFATPVGELSAVVAIGDRGVAAAKVTAKQGVEAAALAEGKESLRVGLVQEELQRLLSAILNEAKREDLVTINAEVVDRFKPRET